LGKPHSCDSFEIDVLRPENSIVLSCCSQNDAVRQGELVLDSNFGGAEREVNIKVLNQSLLHLSDDLQGLAFIALAKYLLENFQQANGRDDQFGHTLNGWSKLVGVRTVRKIF